MQANQNVRHLKLEVSKSGERIQIEKVITCFEETKHEKQENLILEGDEFLSPDDNKEDVEVSTHKRTSLIKQDTKHIQHKRSEQENTFLKDAKKIQLILQQYKQKQIELKEIKIDKDFVKEIIEMKQKEIMSSNVEPISLQQNLDNNDEHAQEYTLTKPKELQKERQKNQNNDKSKETIIFESKNINDERVDQKENQMSYEAWRELQNDVKQFRDYDYSQERSEKADSNKKEQTEEDKNELFALDEVLPCSIAETQISKLNWSDFKGSPNYQLKWSAHVFWGIDYSYTVSQKQGKNKKVTYVIRPEVQVWIKNTSWTKKHNAHLLNHEQGHYVLGCLCALEFKKQILTQKFSDNYKFEIPRLFDKILREYIHIEKRYDFETDHRLDREQQKIWDHYLLQKIKDFKAHFDQLARAHDRKNKHKK